MIKTLSFAQIRQEKLVVENKILNIEKIEYIDTDTQKSGLYTMVIINNYVTKCGFNLLKGNPHFSYIISDCLQDNITYFFKYLYYYSCQIPDHFDFLSRLILDTTLPDQLKLDITNHNNYTQFHKFIVKELKNDIKTSIIDNYRSFTYAIIKDPDHKLTIELTDILINNNYTITNKDINVAKLIMYDYISHTTGYNNAVIFLSFVDLLQDIKLIICNDLLHLILSEKAPIYYDIYNKLINYYY